jgi:hypothetical protein
VTTSHGVFVGAPVTGRRRAGGRAAPSLDLVSRGAFAGGGLVGVLASGVALVRLLRRGALTIDVGIGRSSRPLGPLRTTIEAPRETVFDVVAAPYLGPTPRALERKLRVLERGTDIVLAEHFTDVGSFVATTVETVRFERPTLVHFRLVRGPVPHVVERFEFVEHEAGTELRYTGELAVDLWAVGRWWGTRVARKWEAAVLASLGDIKREAERRAAAGR